MKNEYGEPMLVCPECGSKEVALTAEQMFMANTGDHYCHSVKTNDANSKATCLACNWVGRRLQLGELK
jgi:ssDNA-binding Zn-finger/Zn-ribbon topoisomerase 1